MTDQKEEYRNFCISHLDKMRKVKLPKIGKHKWTMKEAVIVEFRIFPHLEFVIRNAINKLGQTWSHTVVCGRLNYMFMKEMCEKINMEMINNYGTSAGQMRIIKIDSDNFEISQYSLLLANKEFWESLLGEKILIYQDDTCIFEENIDDFLEFDYIGAQFPTNIYSGTYVGNGGLSLRTKSKMIEVINKQSIIDTKMDMECDEIREQYARANGNILIIPEDVYFCKVMNENGIGKLGNLLEANKFSVEHCYNDKIHPFGGHCFWYSILDWKKYMIERVIEKLT
jgi:hypothetical protein